MFLNFYGPEKTPDVLHTIFNVFYFYGGPYGAGTGPCTGALCMGSVLWCVDTLRFFKVPLCVGPVLETLKICRKNPKALKVGRPYFWNVAPKCDFGASFYKTSNAFISAIFEDMNTL